MKNLHVSWLISLASILLLVSGCNTTPQAMDTTDRFHEAASVNVVVKFHRWDNLFIVQPQYRDAGFLRPLRREELGKAFNTLKVQRDTAVVLMGLCYSAGELAHNLENWKSLLAGYGFRRVVFLRDIDQKKLDGSTIIYDWKQSVEKPKQTAQL